MLFRHLRRLLRNKKQGRDGKMLYLKRYAFYKPSGRMCPVHDVLEEEAYAIGKVYGKNGVADGTVLRTYPIVDMYDKVIVTSSGAVYVLEDAHPDYAEYLTVRAARTL